MKCQIGKRWKAGLGKELTQLHKIEPRDGGELQVSKL